MAKIQDAKAREILDSRGHPTVEVDLFLDNGTWGRAAVPSGASTGSFEAVELRDKDPKRYLGQGVKKAVENVNGLLSGRIKGFVSERQREFDHFLCEIDGTPNKEKLGANALLGLSLAYARASATSQGKALYLYLAHLLKQEPQILPVPLMNILNGGKHADNPLDIQEFMVVPAGAPSFREALRMGAELFQQLKKVLKDKGQNTNVGDEGGFAPHFNSNEEALEALLEAIQRAGYKEGKDIYLALDVAATELFKDGAYSLKTRKGEARSSEEMTRYFETLLTEYPILSIEDPLSEEDWSGWELMTSRLKDRVQLVGDDIFVTNVERLKRGITHHVANSILIKLNQIGTLSETLDAIEVALKFNYTAIISHRSGETEDSFIADLAVATGVGQIKTGSLARTDRLCKYNQLLRIEEELGTACRYPGLAAFQRT